MHEPVFERTCYEKAENASRLARNTPMLSRKSWLPVSEHRRIQVTRSRWKVLLQTLRQGSGRQKESLQAGKVIKKRNFEKHSWVDDYRTAISLYPVMSAYSSEL